MRNLAIYSLVTAVLTTLLPGCGTESKEFADARPRGGAHSKREGSGKDFIDRSHGHETGGLANNHKPFSDNSAESTAPSDLDQKPVQLSRR